MLTIGPKRKEGLKRLLSRIGAMRVVRLVHSTFSPTARAWRQRDTAVLQRIGPQLAALERQIVAQAKQAHGVALFIGMSGTSYILQQLPVIAGVVAHGLEPVLVLPSRGSREERRLYQLCGVRRFAYWDEQPGCKESAIMLARLGGCVSQQEVVSLQWRGISVGKYAISTLMRRLRAGQIDLTQPAVRAHLEVLFHRALDHTAAALRLIEHWNPRLGVFVDRGYTPEGPFFEACIARGILPITFNAAHRDNTLMLKRYGPGNANVHPSSLSADTWATLRDVMPWTPAQWERLRDELEFCYKSGQWYGEVGTQFSARLINREALLVKLNLDPSKKTVLLFPHIFWDATFFWGRDVFRDYEEWFRESVRAAWANDKVNWIIKVHPANLVKNHRDGLRGEFSEIRVLREFGAVPPHIRVLPADTDISTLSLFTVGDICLTVRGTVGIEAAMLGLCVVTAGTGRYDGLGFTIDMQTPAEYNRLLGRLQELSHPSPAKVELARRYAYGIFLVRPLEMRSVSFRYERTNDATLQVEIHPAAEEAFLQCPDIQAIASWLSSGDEDLVVGEREGEAAATSRGIAC